MKRYVLFFICLICFSSIGNAEPKDGYGWRRILDKLTFDIAINSQNSNTIYVGGDQKYLYISRDKGLTWETYKIGSGSSSSRYNNLMTNRADSNIVIVGGLGVGDVARTSDNGANWDYVLGEGPYPIMLNGKALVAHPQDDNIYYLSEFESGIIFKSTDRGANWDSIAKVYKPTKLLNENGVLVDSLVYQEPTCLAIRSDSSNIMLCGNQGGAVLLSNDEGKTWSFCGYLTQKQDYQVNRDNEVTMFSFNDKHPLIGYAVITYTVLENLPNGGVWKTTDGGYNWKHLAFPDTSFWAIACRQATETSEEIFVGGYSEDPNEIDSMRIPGDKIVRGSFDGGQTWWKCDPEIDWLDVYPRYFGSGSYNGHTFICGQRSRMSYTDSLPGMWSNVLLGQESWIYTLNDIAPYDSGKAICVGDDGRMFMHKGTTIVFEELTSNSNKDLSSVIFIAPNKFVVAGEGGTILISDDLGESFTNINTKTSNHLFSVSNFGRDSLYAVGEKGIFAKSINGGTTWSSQSIDADTLYSIKCVDDSVIYACGKLGKILKSTNAGTDWVQQNSTVGEALFSIDFYNKDYGIAVGKNKVILRTTDGGANWAKIESPVIQQYYSCNFINDSSIVVVGSSLTVLKSLDSGKVFSVASSSYGPIGNMWSMRYLGAPGQEKLYMATEAGLFVLDNVLEVIDKITKIDPESNLNFIVDKEQLVVTYKRAFPEKNSNITLRIFDMNGREITQRSFNLVSRENLFEVFNLGAYATGSYIIDVLEADQRVSKVFIKP